MLVFSPDLRINISDIDEQHEEIFNRVNSFADMGAQSFSKEEIDEAMRFLGAYVARHFVDEEALMQEWSYPGYYAHKEEHINFTATFAEIQKEYERNGPSMTLAFSLMDVVQNWIVTHIKDSDKKMAEYVVNAQIMG